MNRNSEIKFESLDTAEVIEPETILEIESIFADLLFDKWLAKKMGN